MVNNMECTDPKLITDEVYRFDKGLYTAFTSDVSILERIKQHIPSLSPDFKDLCDADFEMFELDVAVEQLSLRKSPGQDASPDFYKHF